MELALVEAPPVEPSKSAEVPAADRATPPGGDERTSKPVPPQRGAGPHKPVEHSPPRLANATGASRDEPAAPELDEDTPNLDELIAAQFDDGSTQFEVPKPHAARLSAAAVAATALLGRKTRGTATAGAPSPGVGGGPGGTGVGNGARVVTEKFVFGGPEGAFKADVCAVPPRTAAIASIQQCEHLLTFFTDRINVPTRRFVEGFPGIPDRVEWFAIKYTGAFRVRHTATYTFRLTSDDGSQLYIDGQLVVDNDGQHAPLRRSRRVWLAEGEHQLKLKYFQGPGQLLALQLHVARDGFGMKLFRPEF